MTFDSKGDEFDFIHQAEARPREQPLYSYKEEAPARGAETEVMFKPLHVQTHARASSYRARTHYKPLHALPQGTTPRSTSAEQLGRPRIPRHAWCTVDA